MPNHHNKGGKAIIAKPPATIKQEGERMKNETMADVLCNIDVRADVLQDLCRATRDTAEYAGEEMERGIINRMLSMIYIFEDEINSLRRDIEAAMEIDRCCYRKPAADPIPTNKA